MRQDLRDSGFKETQFNTGEIVMNYVVGHENGPPLVLVPAQMPGGPAFLRQLGKNPPAALLIDSIAGQLPMPA